MKKMLIIAIAVMMLMGCLKKAQAADVDFPRINLAGDTAYMPFSKSGGQIAVCAGTTLVTFADELFEIRGEVCPAMDSRPVLYGGGATLSLNNLFVRLGGTLPPIMSMWKSSVGLGVLGDLNLSKIEPAIILTILKVSF